VTTEQATYVDGRWNGRLIRDWIPEVVADVVRAFDPAQIIVFGSVARDEERSESDLDLLVLVDELDPRQRRMMMGRIRRAIDAPIPIDVLVAGIDEYESRRDVNGSPYYWPAREGQVVYDRTAA
jgi:uncharacterized protein